MSIRSMMRGLALTLALLPVIPDHADATPNDHVDVYVRIYNHVTSHDSGRRSRYMVNIRPDLPACTRAQQPRVDPQPSLFEDDIRDMRLALRRGRRLPQDAAATRALDATVRARALYLQASEYYRSRRFEADDCAEGNALHPQLLDAWNEAFTALGEISMFLDEAMAERQAAALADTERRFGRGFRYHHLLLMRHAEAVRALASAEPFDNDAYDSALATYQATNEAARALYAAAEPDTRSDLSRGEWSNFASRAVEFESAAATFSRDMRGGRGPGPTMERLSLKYNALVAASNRVGFTRRVR